MLWGALAGATFGLGAAACAGKPAQTTSAAATAETEADDAPSVSGLNATVLVSKCPDAPHVKVRSAQATIQKLVGPCASVPGGSAHFSATLQPGGAIVLASPEGNPAEGVVPTCVLQNKLVHKLSLKKACTLDVQLDERKVPMTSAGAIADAGSDAH